MENAGPTQPVSSPQSRFEDMVGSPLFPRRNQKTEKNYENKGLVRPAEVENRMLEFASKLTWLG